MQSAFANQSSLHGLPFNETNIGNTSIYNTGNDDFMKWMLSFNPSLLSKYSSLSKESQTKLRTLYYLNLQANSTVDEVIKSINHLESEYEALAQKNLSHLQLIGLGDEEEFSCETHKFLQEAGAFVMQGKVGNGTEVGAAATLAVDFLAHANIARQQLSLQKDIQLIQKRNNRLKDTLNYFERESKVAAAEVCAQQAMLDSISLDLNVSQAKLSNLNRTISLANAELDELGVSPAISNRAILDLYQTYSSVQKEINLINGKLSKYGELPPSITGATSVIASTEQHLESVKNELRTKLTSLHVTKR